MNQLSYLLSDSKQLWVVWNQESHTLFKRDLADEGRSEKDCCCYCWLTSVNDNFYPCQEYPHLSGRSQLSKIWHNKWPFLERKSNNFKEEYDLMCVNSSILARFYIAIIYRNSLLINCESRWLYVVCLEFQPVNNIMSSVGYTATGRVTTQRNSQGKNRANDSCNISHTLWRWSYTNSRELGLYLMWSSYDWLDYFM